MDLSTFHGTHRLVGEAIGKKFARHIRETLSGNVALQERYLPFHRTPEGRLKYEELLGLHRSHFPEYIFELEGISEGVGVQFEELLIANLWDIYEGFAPARERSGCSTCCLVTPGNVVFGHNEDNLPIYHDQMYLVRMEITGKPAFTTLCYPGFLPGRSFGFNSEGICFSSDALQPKNIVTGLGRHFIARSLFEANSIEQAIQSATVSGRGSGFHYAIGSLKERRIVSLEVSPDNHHVLDIKETYFHANHYLRLANVEQSVTSSSKARQHRGEQLLSAGAVRDEADVLKVLRDREVPDFPILRDGRSPDNSMTLVTGFFNIASQEFVIHPGGVKRGDGQFEPVIRIPMAE